VSKINTEKAKSLVLEALYTDGSHHKQWYLENIAKTLGVDLESERQKFGDWEKSKAP